MKQLSCYEPPKH